MNLRNYQQRALDDLYRHLAQKDNNPLIVLPTGAGKSPLMAAICRDAVGLWKGRVLILAHVKELLTQTADKLNAICPDVPVGIYSAGLKSRDTLEPVIVAGIQSVYKRAKALGHFDLVLVDECHRLPTDGEGTYRTLLKELKEINPILRIIGLTATPYRLDCGMICGPDNLLHEICHETGVRELIAQGYLCPLVSKASKLECDFSEVHVRNGEFASDEVEAVMSGGDTVEAACKEIVDCTLERRSCIIFACSVKHGGRIAETLTKMNQKVESVFGDTLDFERDRILEDFKAGRIKYLVNVGVLTTGFDAPNIDCVALLRPTLSPGLYYQMIGRGFRLHPAKKNCLILDFGGNVIRHGPVDAININGPDKRDKPEAKIKMCPACRALISPGYSVCPQCGYEFPKPPLKTPHDKTATSMGVISGQEGHTRKPVTGVFYSVHQKRDAPPEAPKSLRVDYETGVNQYQSEWICIEHNGYAYEKAVSWWLARCPYQVDLPTTAEEACELAREGFLNEPNFITVRHIAGQKFDSVIHYEYPAPATAQTDVAVSTTEQDQEQDQGQGLEPLPEYQPVDDQIPF